MRLTVLSPKNTIFDGDVEGITAPGELGELTVLANHIPILTSLKKGVITAHGREEKKYFEVSENGIFEFADNRAVILLS